MAALSACALVLGMGACGDDEKRVPGSSSGPSAAAPGSRPIAKPDWLERADAICSEGRAEREALPEPTTLAEIAAFSRQAADSLERQNQAIRDLGTPQGDRPLIGKLIDRFDLETAALRQIAEAATAGDLAAVDAAAVDPVLRLRLDSAATDAAAYGLRVCGTAER